MKKREKGQIRIIEAFLAVLIIFSSLTISARIVAPQGIAEADTLAHTGIQALIKLDYEGSLSEYIESGNWQGLRESLSLLLPTGVSFNVTVYDREMRQINGEAVSNGGFNSQNIAFVKYVCVSRNPAFNYYVVHMHLAVAK
ncbi:MAG: hypothetical protein N0A00_02405 [Candidatus Bathyarchaeota archaeon]|nr:hypothetical protein [Candidatus Bathyarchaeota archaeon]